MSKRKNLNYSIKHKANEKYTFFYFFNSFHLVSLTCLLFLLVFALFYDFVFKGSQRKLEGAALDWLLK
jgi:hypothetical protein